MRCPGVSRSSRRPAFATVLVAALVAIPAPSQAVISSVTVSPEAPTEEDPIHVQVWGWFGDGCWSLQEFDCGTPEAGEIALDAFALDEWQPGYVCPTVIVPYAFGCDYDPLPPGHYVVAVMEHHASLRDPFPDTATIEFDVGPLTPVRELSWARIRALYR